MFQEIYHIPIILKIYRIIKIGIMIHEIFHAILDLFVEEEEQIVISFETETPSPKMQKIV